MGFESEFFEVILSFLFDLVFLKQGVSTTYILKPFHKQNCNSLSKHFTQNSLQHTSCFIHIIEHTNLSREVINFLSVYIPKKTRED